MACPESQSWQVGGGHRSFEPSHPDSQPRGSASLLGEVPCLRVWTRCQIHQLLGRWTSHTACMVFWAKLPALHSGTALSASSVLARSETSSAWVWNHLPPVSCLTPFPPSDQPSGRSLTTPSSDAGGLAVFSHGPLLPRSHCLLTVHIRATGSNPDSALPSCMTLSKWVNLLVPPLRKGRNHRPTW